jgi:hypothetical protein
VGKLISNRSDNHISSLGLDVLISLDIPLLVTNKYKILITPSLLIISSSVSIYSVPYIDALLPPSIKDGRDKKSPLGL